MRGPARGFADSVREAAAACWKPQPLPTVPVKGHPSAREAVCSRGKGRPRRPGWAGGGVGRDFRGQGGACNRLTAFIDGGIGMCRRHGCIPDGGDRDGGGIRGRGAVRVGGRGRRCRWKNGGKRSCNRCKRLPGGGVRFGSLCWGGLAVGVPIGWRVSQALRRRSACPAGGTNFPTRLVNG